MCLNDIYQDVARCVLQKIWKLSICLIKNCYLCSLKNAFDIPTNLLISHELFNSRKEAGVF